MVYTVYKHTNKTNGKVYIGITSQDVKRRWQNGAGYYGTYFYNAINKYGWDGFEHEILLENLTEKEACIAEKKLISRYKSNQHEYGYNIAEGGQIVHGSRERVGSLNPRSKSVICKNLDGKIIGTYESQSIAAEKLGIKRKGITKCCRGESKTYMGYVFEYADFEFQKPKRLPRGRHNNHKTTPVALVDADGNVIESFNSVFEAAEKYNCNQNGIAKCCNGYLKTYLGRRWCRAVQC